VRLDAAAKSTGTAVYGIDIEIPNLHYAVLVRCPVFGGTVQGFDASAAQGMPGVVKVLEIYNGVAVVARSYWQARQAAAKLQVDWNTPNKLARFSSADAQAMFSAALNSEDGRRAKHSGDGAKGIEAAAKIIEAKYWAPYLAHATMEPMNCTVRIENGVCDVWTGNQSMQIAAGLAALHGGVHRDAVTVHACYLGGGFGRRLVSDYVAETAAIAKASGLPVQLLWSREDDMQNDCYRPASLVRYTAGIDAAGELTTWTATRVGANLMPGTLDEAVDVLLPEFVPEGMADWISKRGYGVYAGMLVDPASIEGLVADYAVENSEVRHITLDPGLRVGWWRSVGHSYSGFFKESFIDEIAHASGTDPLQWRIDHTAENPRLRNTLQLAAQAANWGKPLAAGRFQGIASHTSFNTMVTQIAEISVANNQIKVHKVVCAVDCGVAVNPQIVRAQIESAVIFGITAALYGEITIVEGVVQQSNFHDYQALRMMEAPEIEVIIVPSSESPTGIGEPGLPPIAGAMGNGVFAATGQRLRSLPLRIS
jgi:CO/xanthine dehydrogenase Mo-binding subunit